MKFSIAGCLLFFATPAFALDDWPQDGGNAQRTGSTAEEPLLPWKFGWAWNGPDAEGGIGGHQYHQPKPYTPWEARVCVGGGMVFAPAGEKGVFALRAEDGAVAWHFTGGSCHATPAYDAAAGVLFLATAAGEVWRLDAKTGKELGCVALKGTLNKALLLAEGKVYALSLEGTLHQLDAATLKPGWTYAAGAAASTLPAYAASTRMVIFCSDDLQVHAVSAATGEAVWKRHPGGRDVKHREEFTAGWPVVAEQHGLVFVRMVFPEINIALWCGGGEKGRWPKTCAGIRERLAAHPEFQNLFALSLADGSTAFIPAVGPAGVEDLLAGSPFLRMPALPVIRKRGAQEVAYVHWRHGDSKDPAWDARWDSHLGEMVLDAGTVSGQAAGDVRFVEFEKQGGWCHVTDESCPLTMAGETLFYAHWDISTSARILDRADALGLARTQPITTEPRPPVVRHLQLKPAQIDPLTHWATGGMTLVDKRFLNGPGWWVYANHIDPPTPTRDGYSEGILPRITIVANGLIVVQGNGGDLFVLKHSGK